MCVFVESGGCFKDTNDMSLLQRLHPLVITTNTLLLAFHINFLNSLKNQGFNTKPTCSLGSPYEARSPWDGVGTHARQ